MVKQPVRVSSSAGHWGAMGSLEPEVGRRRAPEPMPGRYLRLMSGDQPVHAWPLGP